MTARRKKTSDVEAIKVEILPLGNVAKEVVVAEGATIREALEAYGDLDIDRVEVRDDDGEPLDLDDTVECGDCLTVLTSGKVEGGKA